MQKMEYDLAQQEEFLRRENDQIDAQRKKLMEEVDYVKTIQEKIKNIDLVSEEFAKKALEFDSTSVELKRGSKNALLQAQCYQVKIKSMQFDYEKLQNELKKRSEELKSALKSNQNLTEQKEKWLLQYNCSKVAANKLETQIQTLKSRLEVTDSENVSLRKEIEQIKKELKLANNNLNSCEVRLNRSLEEVEKHKSAVKIQKQNEKDLKDSFKKQLNELTLVIKQSEKNKMEMIQAFKKQMLLIDNLKKQQALLKNLNLAELADLDYMKILDWKPLESENLIETPN